jgi:uncharacterized protein (DUF58 family)
VSVARLTARFSAYITRHVKPQAGSVRLHRRQVYILPTRAGYFFALLLLVMLIGSINYNKSLGFILTFFLGSLAIVSILHTYRNLVNLSIRSAHALPVFAKQRAGFKVYLENQSTNSRYGIGISGQDIKTAFVDVPAQGTRETMLCMKVNRRGVNNLDRLTVFTRFPLGLFRSWSWIEFTCSVLVYPAPEQRAPNLPECNPGHGEQIAVMEGSDDYFGLRNYQLGDSPRHIAWKAVARQQGLLTKQFANNVSKTIWLNWEATTGLDIEARLSRLCRWALDAEAAGHRYGLHLPNTTLQPDCGEEHKHQCLKALALYSP